MPEGRLTIDRDEVIKFMADGEPSGADVVEWLSQKLNIDDDDIEEARPYDHDAYNADAAYEKAQNSLAWEEMHGGGL